MTSWLGQGVSSVQARSTRLPLRRGINGWDTSRSSETVITHRTQRHCKRENRADSGNSRQGQAAAINENYFSRTR